PESATTGKRPGGLSWHRPWLGGMVKAEIGTAEIAESAELVALRPPRTLRCNTRRRRGSVRFGEPVDALAVAGGDAEVDLAVLGFAEGQHRHHLGGDLLVPLDLAGLDVVLEAPDLAGHEVGVQEHAVEFGNTLAAI